jgi:hypothetical protein
MLFSFQENNLAVTAHPATLELSVNNNEYLVQYAYKICVIYLLMLSAAQTV